MISRKLILLIIGLLLLIGCARTNSNPQPARADTATEPTRLASTAQPSAIPPRPTKVEAPLTPSPMPSTIPVDTQSEGILSPVAGIYQFTEGPAVDANGDVYFSDINAGQIYKWSAESGQVTVFRGGLKGPNGLAFDRQGKLVVCEGGNGRLIAIDPQGQIIVLADKYNQTRFNEPNDLWIDPQGGIYFTDPAYQSPVVQDGEHVYYLTPDRSQVLRVISDLVRPNGIAGTPDGKTLYVADHGAEQIIAYDLGVNGALSNKRQAIASGSDGLKLDAQGNLCLTAPNQIRVYNAAGQLLREIRTPENPTNLAFAGADRRTLFITARTAVYTFRLPADWLISLDDTSAVSNSVPASTQSFTLSSIVVSEMGNLPTEYTCDGASATLPLAWSGAPAQTQSFAVVMHHVAGPDDIHWYWVLYNIPPEVTLLAKNTTAVGTLGTNSVNKKSEYAPPCSQGPGPKMYTYTVYALSAYPSLSVPTSQVNRQVLLDAIGPITLASAELHVTYSRK